MNNGKKEFPFNGLEQDCTSKWGKKHLANVSNIRGIRSFVKRQLNKRMRKANKGIDELSDITTHG
ncbi:hypothetical protein [Sphingobacterium kyonggiense]